MLIFLDIDGVMVPAKSWKSPELLSDGFPAFSAKAVKILRSLISDATTVMLTTSHRSRYTVVQWKKIFQRRGIDVVRLQKLNSNPLNMSRKDEILNWLHANNIADKFIIIDDDTSLNALPPDLKENLILTSPMIGLTDASLAK